jgi:DNA-binding MarR family transcriptional regulator
LSLRETAARAAGIEPQQYLLLLQLKGLEDREPTTVGVLAERLQVRHHTAVGLVDRLVARGMVVRRRDQRDRRGVLIVLRPKGRAVLKRLALYSLAELEVEGPALLSVLTRLMKRSTRQTRGEPRHRKDG